MASWRWGFTARLSSDGWPRARTRVCKRCGRHRLQAGTATFCQFSRTGDPVSEPQTPFDRTTSSRPMLAVAGWISAFRSARDSDKPAVQKRQLPTPSTPTGPSVKMGATYPSVIAMPEAIARSCSAYISVTVTCLWPSITRAASMPDSFRIRVAKLCRNLCGVHSGTTARTQPGRMARAYVSIP